MLNQRSDKVELLRIAEAVAAEKSIDKEIILSSNCSLYPFPKNNSKKLVNLDNPNCVFCANLRTGNVSAC